MHIAYFTQYAMEVPSFYMEEIMNIKIAGTVNDSIVDGPGLRFTIFVQGCPHGCPGCHNPHTHDFGGGAWTTTEALLEKIRANPLLDGVTFSGGEPFCQAESLSFLGRELKSRGYNIITYTGFTFEYLLERASETNFYKELLTVTDILVDGPFELDKKNYELRFKGSENQRILNVSESLLKKEAVETSL